MWQKQFTHGGEVNIQCHASAAQIPIGGCRHLRTGQTGQTIGCFQIESPGMRATLTGNSSRILRDDIMSALALYRPGTITRWFERCLCAQI